MDVKISSEQKNIEMKIKNNEFHNRKELEDAYNIIDNKMRELRLEFEKNTKFDKKLAEHFKDNNKVGAYTSIMVAGSILGGIQLRNIWRENGKLDGEREEFPYNKEQIEMIDKYNCWQDTMDRLEQYVEYVFEDEEELE